MWDKNSFVSNELNAFEEYLRYKYKSRNRFLNDVSQKVMLSEGKRLRPALVIISGMMGNYNRDRIFPLAAAIETLHTATLVHDDIIDDAKTRRGQLTVSEKHGINIAVYTGDYLLANSILFLSESGLSTDNVDKVAKAARTICAGEINQYLNRGKLTSVNEYLKRVMKKTGILFSASCAVGAYASGCSEKHVNTMSRFGMNLGVAFQIRDDLIDIDLNKSRIKRPGKPITSDIRSGIITIPFIFSANRSEKIKRGIEELFEKSGNTCIEGCDDNDIERIIFDVIENGGVDDAKNLKERYIQKSRTLLEKLTNIPNESREALEQILSWL